MSARRLPGEDGFVRAFTARLPTHAVLCLLLLPVSSRPPRLAAVPKDLAASADIPGMPGVRFLQWSETDQLEADANQLYERQLENWKAAGNTGPLPPAYYLAISGGGENGAFGAGLLVGWSATGNRPMFKGVTGVSTGALTAPFAFLGPAYDDKLKQVYTSVSGKDVLEARGYLAAIFDDAMADNAPLRRLVTRVLDQSMLDAIAAEHEKGRRHGFSGSWRRSCSPRRSSQHDGLQRCYRRAAGAIGRWGGTGGSISGAA